MFGFFRKKQASKPIAAPSLEMDLRQAVTPILHIYESLSADISKSYSDLDHDTVELRFFSMAVTSLLIQAFGDLPHEKMQALVDEFYDQSAANLLLSMPQPRADFSDVHTAAAQKSAQYANLICDVIDAGGGNAAQEADLSLMIVLDGNLNVERGAFERAVAGVRISMLILEYSLIVKAALEDVRGAI